MKIVSFLFGFLFWISCVLYTGYLFSCAVKEGLSWLAVAAALLCLWAVLILWFGVRGSIREIKKDSFCGGDV
jgi:membrane protein DedA with SNARE-associated domain